MSEHCRRVVPLAEILARIEDVPPEALAQLDQLHTGGLASHDLLADQTPGPLHMPLPFADIEKESFLSQTARLRELLQELGFQQLARQDITPATVVFFKNLPLPDPVPPSLRARAGRQYAMTEKPWLFR